MLNRDPPHHWKLDMDPPHHMMLKGDLQALIDVHTHGGTSKIHHKDVPPPVESYRLHLTPLLWPG